MGRWAQAKRRGGRPAAAAALGPPPAPTIAWGASTVIQTANCAGNEGGEVVIYWSAEVGGAVSVVDIDPWEEVHDWGELGDPDPGFYVAVQMGNHTAYEGVSVNSNWIPVPKP